MTTLPVYLIHWNAPEWCASAARSILGSEGLDVELTVIDNGSERPGRLEALLPPQVRLLSTGRNLGYTGGANVALRDWLTEDPCEFCVIGSHDLHVLPATLSSLLAAAKCNEDIGILGPILIGARKSAGGIWDGREARHKSILDAGPETIMPCDWIDGMCMLIRRECARDLRCFDERFGSYVEDVDFCLRAKDAGWIVAVSATAKARGLGSISGTAPALIPRNSLLLQAKRNRGQMVRTWSHIIEYFLRTSLASVHPLRPRSQRLRSLALARAHGQSLRMASKVAISIAVYEQPNPSGENRRRQESTLSRSAWPPETDVSRSSALTAIAHKTPSSPGLPAAWIYRLLGGYGRSDRAVGGR